MSHRLLLDMIQEHTGGGTGRVRMLLRTWKWESLVFPHVMIDMDPPPNVETTGLTSSRETCRLHLHHDQSQTEVTMFC